MEKLLKEAQVAEILGVSGRLVRKLAFEGRLERIKIGSTTRFRPSDIRKLIDGEMPKVASRRPSAATKRQAGRDDAEE